LKPLRQQVAALTARIRQYDGQIEIMAQKRYPHSGLLRQVKGVGALTAVAYMLTLEDPARFEKSREVGPYLGLVPRQDDSGDSSPPLGITKTGDTMLRRLLVGSAHYILGPFERIAICVAGDSSWRLGAGRTPRKGRWLP